MQVDLNARIDATHNFYKDEVFNFGVDLSFQSDFFSWKNVSLQAFQYRYSLPKKFDYFMDSSIRDKLDILKSLDIGLMYEELTLCEPSANSFWVFPRVTELFNELLNVWLFQLDTFGPEQKKFGFIDLLSSLWDTRRALHATSIMIVDNVKVLDKTYVRLDEDLCCWIKDLPFDMSVLFNIILDNEMDQKDIFSTEELLILKYECLLFLAEHEFKKMINIFMVERIIKVIFPDNLSVPFVVSLLRSGVIFLNKAILKAFFVVNCKTDIINLEREEVELTLIPNYFLDSKDVNKITSSSIPLVEASNVFFTGMEATSVETGEECFVDVENELLVSVTDSKLDSKPISDVRMDDKLLNLYDEQTLL